MTSPQPDPYHGNGIPVVLPVRQALGPEALRGMTPTEIDWDRWARHIESRRRKLPPALRDAAAPPVFSTRQYLGEASYVSFRLEELDVTEPQVALALARGRGGRDRALRSRQGQRLRNHAAALLSVDAQLRTADALTPDTYMRWYASISCGLCPADMDEATRLRLAEQLQRMNFPELRPSAALQSIARQHAALLADPLVPSFNGILARLLLRYHLGRCHLPPVFFHPDTPPAALANERHLLPILMESLETSFDVMTA